MGAPALQYQSAQGRGRDDQWKWQMEEVNCDKRQGREDSEENVTERASTNADERDQDNGNDHRLHAVQQPAHDRHIAVRDGEPAQSEQHEYRRQDEVGAGNNPPEHAVESPAEVDGQLSCLWAWQQHREIQRAQEQTLGDPALLIDQLAVHARDLPRRAAEADEAELQPEAKRITKRDDWLGISHHPQLVRRAASSAERWAKSRHGSGVAFSRSSICSSACWMMLRSSSWCQVSASAGRGVWSWKSKPNFILR